MNLLAKPLRHLTPSEFRSFIRRSVPEGQFLDYKSNYYGNSDEEKVQLLKHVCGFANGGGGLLIFGVDEIDERPSSVPGVPNDPTLAQRLALLVRDCIEPTIPTVEFRYIAYGKVQVFLLSVGYSPEAPHLVTFGRHQRYYLRRGTSTFPMTNYELRYALFHTNASRLSTDLGLPPQAKPINIEFLSKLYNSLSKGNAALAQSEILDYIRTINEQLNTRESTIDAVVLTSEGLLETSDVLKSQALKLAKANTYLNALTREAATVLSTLGLLRGYLSDLKALGDSVPPDLIRIRHKSDRSYKEVLKALENLLEFLSSGERPNPSLQRTRFARR